MKKNKKATAQKRILQIIMGVTMVGFIACVGIIGYYYYTLHKGSETYDQLAQTYVTEQSQELQTVQETEQESTLESVPYVSPIDFATLQAEENEDVYAWIKIPDTAIDYPVLQHPEDDSYYLTHAIDGTYGYPGAIYTELYNTKTFAEPMTVIYGHYMKNGTMFTDLHKFMDKDFFDSHDTITIYTEEEQLEYEIYAAYYTDDKRILVWYNFEDETGIQEYLDDVASVTESETDHIRTDMTVTTQDQLIALETCVDEKEDLRYVVIGVKKKDN